MTLDVVAYALIAFLGLIAYVDFLLSKEAKAKIAKSLGTWRDALADVPVFRAPQREMEFAQGFFRFLMMGPFLSIPDLRSRSRIGEHLISFWWGIRQFFLGWLICLPIGGLTCWLAARTNSLLSPGFDVLFATIVVCSASCWICIAFIYFSTALTLSRLPRAKVLAFFTWHVLSLVFGALIGSLALYLLVGGGSLIRAAFTGNFTEVLDRILDLRSTSSWEGVLFYRANVQQNIPIVAFMSFSAVTVFWLRIGVLIAFIVSWLVAPLTIRFAFLNIRGLAEAEKGHLTLAAVGLSAFVKAMQELLKAILK